MDCRTALPLCFLRISYPFKTHNLTKQKLKCACTYPFQKVSNFNDLTGLEQSWNLIINWQSKGGIKGFYCVSFLLSASQLCSFLFPIPCGDEESTVSNILRISIHCLHCIFHNKTTVVYEAISKLHRHSLDARGHARRQWIIYIGAGLLRYYLMKFVMYPQHVCWLLCGWTGVTCVLSRSFCHLWKLMKLNWSKTEME